MSTQGRSLGELLNEWEPERLAEIAREEARANTPKARADLEAKKRDEFERGVRLGWWDADGVPLPQTEDEEDDHDD